jgi:hypothetical protein
MKKDYKLPEWADWGNLWVKGFLCLLISIIYFIPLAIIAAIMSGPILSDTLSALISSNPQALVSALGAAGSTLVIVALVGMLIIYIVPIAIMLFVDKGNFSDAFKFGMVFKKAFTSKYFVAWIIVMIYSWVIVMVAGLLSAITTITVILPLIILGFMNMIVLITSMTIFGEVYSELK